ncbi:splicing regulatory glutamine lysine-rich protein 1-like [Limosa lapponica baueri]|uniref:Splicing regulatory glutamine lysine-rich protein 1-like n=1 Tax=Limosa lapponica baueri TaxID=1758121 RepID=A0A2I0T582_LIMLA|nr:splicing regulatory glutamine lysine-rich protein 1-like [Limosa lapponica baueri]
MGIKRRSEKKREMIKRRKRRDPEHSQEAIALQEDLVAPAEKIFLNRNKKEKKREKDTNNERREREYSTSKKKSSKEKEGKERSDKSITTLKVSCMTK